MHPRVGGVRVEDGAFDVGHGDPDLHGLHGLVEGAQEALALALRAHVLEERDHVGDHPVVEDRAPPHAEDPRLAGPGLAHLVEDVAVVEDAPEPGQQGLEALLGQHLGKGPSHHLRGRPAVGAAFALGVPSHYPEVAVDDVEPHGQGLQRGLGDAVRLIGHGYEL